MQSADQVKTAFFVIDSTQLQTLNKYEGDDFELWSSIISVYSSLNNKSKIIYSISPQ